MQNGVLISDGTYGNNYPHHFNKLNVGQCYWGVYGDATYFYIRRGSSSWIRGHWQIEVLHRDVSYGDDASQIRTGSGPQVMASCATSASRS